MDDDDDENDADNQKILQEPEEEPLPPSDNKSFDMKKFRASLRQGDCIIGKKMLSIPLRNIWFAYLYFFR